jgi:release factor glutamine methyltransferase
MWRAVRYGARVTPEQSALVELGRALRAADYTFVTVTPETHRRVLARLGSAPASGTSLRDVFGWSRPFAPAALPAELRRLLERADALEEANGLLRSRVRFSSLGERLHVHSAFPTGESDAVFFGPDTYRFCALLRRWAPRARRALDIGCGSGAGGLSLTAADELILSDVSPRALALAEVNAALSGRTATFQRSDVLKEVDGPLDLIVANPPYMRDPSARLYRDGGGEHGEGLSVRIVRESLARLAPGGTLIVYTGSAVVDGVDCFRRAIMPHLSHPGARVDYEELDPDVFGEELERPDYARVERIAAVGVRVCVT